MKAAASPIECRQWIPLLVFFAVPITVFRFYMIVCSSNTTRLRQADTLRQMYPYCLSVVAVRQIQITEISVRFKSFPDGEEV